jgi:hypothetical protein
MLHEYHVIYSIQYYQRFHATVVGLGMYYLWIQGHTRMSIPSECYRKGL